MWAANPWWFSNLSRSWFYFSKELGWGCDEMDNKNKFWNFLRIKTGEVRKFGGFPHSFWGHLSKNPNHFLFLLLPSNPLSPGLTPHHNICFLSPLSQPPLAVSHLYPPDSSPPILKAHSCALSTSATLINSKSNNSSSNLFRRRRGDLNCLHDTTGWCSAVDNIPEALGVTHSTRQKGTSVGFKLSLLNQGIKIKESRFETVWGLMPKLQNRRNNDTVIKFKMGILPLQYHHKKKNTACTVNPTSSYTSNL